ncbi:4-hydroxybenzoate polyprenyltransferase [Leifsonia sp. AK011]|uniref:SCO3242 family prenyltransferase n=1 Tax=Leifsonia sp. AK011 TaxID=2723075 RepID=UPI0017A22CC9|nr:UbiA family prenyltransferase [Leifsonia sp. AK011]NYF10433.1 4-hydroxybenzoate polyprenyltransferase [Leifsonia sp. AK011]
MPLRDYRELVRAPAAFSVLGDAVVGASWAGRPLHGRALGIPIASALLYWSGMALNDLADADLDAIERPERPIPSGRISRRAAGITAAALAAGGIAAAGIFGGRRSVALAVPLAAAIATYNLVAKEGPFGPAVMAACRGLDVLMGAGSDRMLAAAPAAAIVAAHTANVTVLSRGEVHGSTSRAVAGSVAATAGVAAATVAVPAPAAAGVDASLGRTAGALATARFGVTVGVPQSEAVLDPTAGTIRTATRAGIMGMIPLQAGLAARAGNLVASIALIGLDITLKSRAAKARSAQRGQEGGSIT